MPQVYIHEILEILHLTGIFQDRELRLQKPACVIGDLTLMEQDPCRNKTQYNLNQFKTMTLNSQYLFTFKFT